MKKNTNLGLAVFFFFFCLVSVTSDLEADRRALIALRNSVHGSPLLWNLTAPTCTWAGVLCSSGRVTALRLPAVGLSGPLPLAIGNLTKFATLSLRFNNLNGPLPPVFANLTLLRYLYLQGNAFSGEIPSFLFSLPNIIRINLAQNKFSGRIPANVNSATRLATLYLQDNQLTGPLPEIKIPLKQFNVSFNQLNGSIPDPLSGMPKTAFEGNLLCGKPLDACSVRNGTETPGKGKSDIKGLPSGTIVFIAFVGFIIILGIIAALCCTKQKNGSEELGRGVQDAERNELVRLWLENSIQIKGQSSRSTELVQEAERNELVQEAAVPLTFSGGDDFSQSPTTNSNSGKLVMFSGEPDFSTGTNALLNKDCELSRGGFGAMYRTVIRDGYTVAIKNLTVSSLVKSQEEFEREVKKLIKLRHSNLVKLEGYYWTTSLQLLSYEFLSGKSLYKHLHEAPGGSSSLSWNDRFNVILGTAKCLAYLHQSNIIHYNIKSSNVLLDISGEPKVGDYGLARLLPMLDSYVLRSKIPSALGYMPPEFACRAVKITEKCDVYGFGVLVLEVVSGKKPVEYMEDDIMFLSDMVRETIEHGRVDECIDLRLRGKVPVKEAIAVIKLGLLCTSQVPSWRPHMGEAVNTLTMIR